MKRAILDLYENPHNRFKIFKNGQMMYTEKIGNQADVDQHLRHFFNDYFDDSNNADNVITDELPNGNGINFLASMLCSALLNRSDLSPELLSLVPEKKRSQFCNTKSSPLPKGCILNGLLNLQKISGEINDTKAEAISHKLLGDVKSSDELHNLTIWYPLITPALSSTSEKILVDQFGHSQKFVEELKQLQKFLLSVTAKDVSLLITFRRVEDANLENDLHLPKLTMRSNQMMRVMISVIDLDPKAVHRIPTWIEKRQDWMNSYLQN